MMSNVIALKVLRRSEIHTYMHCAKCLDEFYLRKSNQFGSSLKEYQMIEVGCTERGLQIWCLRHNENVLHLDIDSQKLRAI